MPLIGSRLSLLGDIASILGLVISLVGFGVTIWNVRKSKAAAELAKQAAETARSTLLRVDSVAEISAVIGGLEETQRLHRTGSWESMPERYGVHRRMLIGVRAANPSLTDAQKARLQAAIQQLSLMQRQVEAHLGDNDNQLSAVKLNAVVAKHADNLTELLAELKVNGDSHDDQR